MQNRSKRLGKGCDRVWNVSLLGRTMGAPGRGCEAGGPAEGGRGGGVMGYLQSLVGTAPGSLIGTVLQSGSRFPGRRTRVIAVASPPSPPLHPDPPRGEGGLICVVRLTRLDPETES